MHESPGNASVQLPASDGSGRWHLWEQQSESTPHASPKRPHTHVPSQPAMPLFGSSGRKHSVVLLQLSPPALAQTPLRHGPEQQSASLLQSRPCPTHAQ
jgi:hypothetical protein